MTENVLLNEISEKEYELLNDYRNWYAWQDSALPTANVQPIKTVLNEWANQNKTLYRLLGNNLIIQKEIFFQKDVTQLQEEIEEIWLHRSFGREQRQGWQFKMNLLEWARKVFPTSFLDFLEENEENCKNMKIRSGIIELISNYNLATNSFEGETFTIPLTNGKEYVVNKGCKVIKALAKIANSYNIEGFEDFRICHSLIHNQKNLSGTVYLSIHPLDYWTMSDNDCDWDSCMNWRDCGGYRQGTVEMMNSPCVLVAYLTATEPMSICHGTWNSKRWRQLFIADEDIILGIKDYPYANDELNIEIAEWIKSLAETNLGWKYLNEKPYHYSGMPFKLDEATDTKPLELCFSTNQMYNDIGSRKWHPLFIGENFYEHHKDNNHTSSRNFTIYFTYSGASQCVMCGQLGDGQLACESSLCCDECENITSCYLCGERIYNDDCYIVNDEVVCSYCCEERCYPCASCGDTNFIDNMEVIEIILPVSEEYKKKFNYNCNFEFVFDDTPKICEDCLEEFKTNYIKPDVDMVKLNGVFRINVEDLIRFDIFPVRMREDIIKGSMSWDEIVDKYRVYVDYRIIY